MNMRSSRSIVKFSHPFAVSGYPDELAAGEYEILVEEELLQGLSFTAYRRTATYLAVHLKAGCAGRTELRPVDEEDLEMALRRDRALGERTDEG